MMVLPLRRGFFVFCPSERLLALWLQGDFEGCIVNNHDRMPEAIGEWLPAAAEQARSFRPLLPVF